MHYDNKPMQYTAIFAAVKITIFISFLAHLHLSQWLTQTTELAVIERLKSMYNVVNTLAPPFLSNLLYSCR